MVVAIFVQHLKLDHDLGQKGDLTALLAKVGRYVEGELICANRQRLVGEAGDSAVVVGLVGRQQHQVAAIPTRERDRYTRGRLAALGIQYVGRERWVLRGHRSLLSALTAAIISRR